MTQDAQEGWTCCVCQKPAVYFSQFEQLWYCTRCTLSDYLNALEAELDRLRPLTALAEEAQLIVKEMRRTATRESQDVFVKRLRYDWSPRYDAEKQRQSLHADQKEG